MMENTNNVGTIGKGDFFVVQQNELHDVTILDSTRIYLVEDMRLSSHRVPENHIGAVTVGVYDWERKGYERRVSNNTVEPTARGPIQTSRLIAHHRRGTHGDLLLKPGDRIVDRRSTQKFTVEDMHWAPHSNKYRLVLDGAVRHDKTLAPVKWIETWLLSGMLGIVSLSEYDHATARVQDAKNNGKSKTCLFCGRPTELLDMGFAGAVYYYCKQCKK